MAESEQITGLGFLLWASEVLVLRVRATFTAFPHFRKGTSGARNKNLRLVLKFAIYNFDLFHSALPVNIVILVNVVAPNFLFRNRIVYLVLFLLIIITTNLVYLILACSI